MGDHGQAGADVILHGLGETSEIEAFRSELEAAHGCSVRYVNGDLSTANGVAQMCR